MMKILIDNGHGVNTPGKRSPKWANGTQLFEWAYTREIAKRVEAELKKRGIDVERIVTEIQTLHCRSVAGGLIK